MGEPGISVLPISVVVLTLDEERNLEACLRSLGKWPFAVFVVDSGSADATLEVARRHGARVVTHPFEGHSRQWSWAFQNLPLETEWTLALDADQTVTPELASELAGLLGGGRLPVESGFYVARRQVFRGRWIRYGGYYPKYLLKLFRRSAVTLDDGDLVDHHFRVSGPTRILRHDIVERNVKEDSIGFWTEKHNRYSDLQAREELSRRRSALARTIEPAWFGNPDQRTLWLKEWWYRMPLGLRPFLYFFYRYVLRLGFLDGKEGFLFHFLQAFWYRLLVDIKLGELLSEPPRPTS